MKVSPDKQYMCALKEGNFKKAIRLIKSGVNVHCGEDAILRYAAKYMNREAMDYGLSHGCDINLMGYVIKEAWNLVKDKVSGAEEYFMYIMYSGASWYYSKPYQGKANKHLAIYQWQFTHFIIRDDFDMYRFVIGDMAYPLDAEHKCSHLLCALRRENTKFISYLVSIGASIGNIRSYKRYDSELREVQPDMIEYAERSTEYHERVVKLSSLCQES